MEIKLTRNEKRVLIELLKNARATDREISRKTGLSRPTVAKARKSLEQKSVILGYTTKTRLEAIGLGINAIIFYRWRDYSKTQELEETIRFIRSLPEVVLYIQGEGMGSKTDVIISLHKNLREYEEFIRNLKKQWRDNVEDVEVFLSSMEGVHKRYDLSSPVLRILEENKEDR